MPRFAPAERNLYTGQNSAEAGGGCKKIGKTFFDTSIPRGVAARVLRAGSPILDAALSRHGH